MTNTIKKIELQTIIRVIVLLLALINQSLTAMGKSPLPFEDETITELISAIFTIIAAVWAWWKNNSFTYAAIEADEVLKKLRDEEKYNEPN